MINYNYNIKQELLSKNHSSDLKDDKKQEKDENRQKVENMFTKLFESKKHTERAKVLSVSIINTYKSYFPYDEEIKKRKYLSTECVSKEENKFINVLSKPYYPKNRTAIK